MSEESIPILSHIPGNFQPTGPAKKDNHTVYSYADVSSAGFIVPGHADFKITSAGVAHTRSLTFLKKHLNGPYFDLEKIWEEHTWYEFGDRSVEKTMATMVQEPYVNHIPTVSLTSLPTHDYILRLMQQDDGGNRTSTTEQVLPGEFHLQQPYRHRTGTHQPDGRHGPDR